MVWQKVNKIGMASEEKKFPTCPQANYWGLLRRFTPRNDILGNFLRNHHS